VVLVNFRGPNVMFKKDQDLINRLENARIHYHKANSPEEKKLRKELVLRLEKNLEYFYLEWEKQDQMLETKMSLYSADDAFN
jgi:RNA binding exosome subunit